MTPEEKNLLERTYKLAVENNEILRGLRRSNRIGTVVRIFYWSLIIIVSFGSYFFIQPYIGQILSSYSGIEDSFLRVRTASDAINKYIPN